MKTLTNIFAIVFALTCITTYARPKYAIVIYGGGRAFASSQTNGVSGNGRGENSIRLGFTRNIEALTEYKNLSGAEVFKAEICKLSELKGTSGVIALNKYGNIAMEFNTTELFRRFLKSSGEKEVAIF